MAGGVRRWRLMLIAGLAIALLVFGCAKWWENRQYRRAMARVHDEMEQGLHALAARDLVALLARDPGSDEPRYWLGVCERARGRPEAAADVWTTVSPDSTFGPRAIKGRMELELEQSRLAKAEEFIKSVDQGAGRARSDASIFLGPIYSQEGRVFDAKRLIEESWDRLNDAGERASEKGINLIRLYHEIQAKPVPLEATRAFLDQSAVSSPDDDRIWLGKANLAIRTGSYDEAARWLSACLRRRPEDVAVWRAYLDRGVAANDFEAVSQALVHLPSSEATIAEVERLAAWLAARRGDVELERRALERVIDAEPVDFKARDRLAELAKKRGQPDRALTLQQEKATLEGLHARYQKLHERHQPRRDAVEMAHLAERLGRPFEARAYLTVAMAAFPDRVELRHELARLDERSKAVTRTGQTLAELLAPELAIQQKTKDDSPAATRSKAPLPKIDGP
jgi:enediyne biosynthesis protein E4